MIDSKEFSKKTQKHWCIRWIDFLITWLRFIVGRERVNKWLGLELTVDSILILAQKDVQTEISPFESPQEKLTEIALRVMLFSLEKEAGLTPTGQILCVQKIRNALRNRLQLKILIQEHPEILSEEILQPVFILGLPRSGTTLLHRTLAKTEHFQYLNLFQALHPLENLPPNLHKTNVPSITEIFKYFFRRIFCRNNENRKNEKQKKDDLFYTFAFLTRFLSSRLQAIHDCQLEEAEEESIILDMCFTSQLTEAMYNVPRFQRFLEEKQEPPLFMYSFLKQILQVQQYKLSQRQKRSVQEKTNVMEETLKPVKPWLLKSPNHLEWLHELLQVFPDARFIHIARPLVHSLASTISASCHAQRMYSDSVLIEKVSLQWQHKYHYIIRKVHRQFQILPILLPLIEIHYNHLLSSLACTVFKILKSLNITFVSHICIEPQKHTKKHSYRLNDLYLQSSILAKFPDQFLLQPLK